ncbi:MAG: hypothetical protein KJO64_02515 [Bacteroidia bacterium]|nr:hypothetical protein [Bacteroidia bacterium]NNC86820.1 hypothetical protein [Bacteroidia bacterium]
MHSKNSLLNRAFLLVLFIAGLLSACHSVKPDGGKHRASDYEDFFLGADKNQYFIQPLTYTSENAEMQIDFTFRDYSFKDSATVANFTITSSERIINVDSLIFDNGTELIFAKNLKKLYFEKDKKLNEIRTTSEIDGMELAEILKADNSIIYVYANNKRIQFIPSKKSNKVRMRVYSHLLKDQLLIEE